MSNLAAEHDLIVKEANVRLEYLNSLIARKDAGEDVDDLIHNCTDTWADSLKEFAESAHLDSTESQYILMLCLHSGFVDSRRGRDTVVPALVTAQWLIKAYEDAAVGLKKIIETYTTPEVRDTLNKLAEEVFYDPELSDESGRDS